mmetsp:Transcript_10273/g.22906  ORF Transcript_10273/g.22906 Transcript_10273/m.22906 type:complete len:98 (-) Transcript_10273:87-380(-)
MIHSSKRPVFSSVQGHRFLLIQSCRLPSRPMNPSPVKYVPGTLLVSPLSSIANMDFELCLQWHGWLVGMCIRRIGDLIMQSGEHASFWPDASEWLII